MGRNEISSPDDEGHDDLLTIHFTLNLGIRVHVIKEDEVLSSLLRMAEADTRMLLLS